MLAKLWKSETAAVLADQAAVSGGNFLTTLVLARTLAPAEYGTFSLLFLALFGINTCHSSLVVYPLTLRAATATDQELKTTAASALLHTVALSLPLAAALSLIAIVLHRADLCLSLALAMFAWQVQETARRVLLGSRRTHSSILPDALCYLGQGLLVFVLRPHTLTDVFLLFALTSFAATLWQFGVTGLNFSPVAVKEHTKYAWRMGRYILGGNLLNMMSLQIPGWALAIFAGTPSVAGYQSLLNLVGVANPIIFSASNLLIPAVARNAGLGSVFARKTVVRQGLRYGALLVPCFAALLLAPHAIMRAAYGATSPYANFSGLLRPFVLAFALQYLATVVGAYEGGMSRPHTYLWVQIAGTVTLVAAATTLISPYGIAGAVYAMLLASLTRLIVSLLAAQHGDRRLNASLTSKERLGAIA